MCEDKNVDGILLMGDMTDFGKLDGYKAGLAYVANALQLGGTSRNASTFCGIVPGNHDIDRALATKPSMLAKFKPLNPALDAPGFGRMPVASSLVSHVAPQDPQHALALMTSSGGGGEVA